MSIGSLDHVLVLADDIERTRDFYCEVVGLSVGERPPLEFPGYWLYLGDVPAVHVADRAAYEAHAGWSGATGALDHIAFSASGYEELKARLDAQGVSAVENEIPGVMRQLFIEDSNGVRLELNVRD